MNRNVAGLTYSTVLPCMDFETYSPAGFIWNEDKSRFESPNGGTVKGLPLVGAAKYTEHPEAEVLCLAYDLKNGEPIKLWTPIARPPQDLLDYLNSGGLIEAWNVAFEWWVWHNICVSKYNFPPLSPVQIRCAAAKSRAHGLPGSLDPAGSVLNIVNKKDADGKRLINKFSIPRNPTKNNPSKRLLLSDEPDEAQRLYNYCQRDIQAESEISEQVPDLSEFELKFWQCDHAINQRGIKIDLLLINKCINILEQAYDKYDKELCGITDGMVKSASELPSFKKWLNYKGIKIASLTAKDMEDLLNNPILSKCIRRAIEIRYSLGSASVKKLYSMLVQSTKDSRLHDLFIYHSARTGRAAGSGPQPQNLPNSGPRVSSCPICSKCYYDRNGCPWCGGITPQDHLIEWNSNSVNDAIEILNMGSLEALEFYFNDPIEIISSCLRSLFISDINKDLICSDYSAIEAVVLACIAREQWRIDVFNSHGKIYEMSASKILNIPFDDIHKVHPARKIGKIAELASGYQGWIGAWKNFGAGDLFSDDQLKSKILAWRAASPAIVSLWKGLQDAAIAAVKQPHTEFAYNGIKYINQFDVLYCKLLSGRLITYHRPLISSDDRGKDALSYEGWNTNPMQGKVGWVRMDTYGGKLTENVVQATARDILANAIVNLEENNYPVVLHVHDEIVSEVPENFGNITEFETIMSAMPTWAKDWPIKAKGGWRAKRYNK